MRPILPDDHQIPEPAVHQSSAVHATTVGAVHSLHTKRQASNVRHAEFELLEDDADPAAIVPVSPEIERGMREIAEFQRDPSGYKIAGERSGFFSRFDRSRPAGWFYVRWRACISFVLKVLRWIDSWAYLISVPFVILMIFGIVVGNRAFVHTGAVVVVLANYGRFWADLLALFVRPYKDGPIQGVAFLFPPYTVYYLTRHWNRIKPIVRRMATSCIPIVMVFLAYAFIPAVNPEAAKVHGVGAKLEAGKHELDTEIDSELRNVETKVMSLGKPK
jgi:hypothetical protein